MSDGESDKTRVGAKIPLHNEGVSKPSEHARHADQHLPADDKTQVKNSDETIVKTQPGHVHSTRQDKTRIRQPHKQPSNPVNKHSQVIDSANFTGSVPDSHNRDDVTRFNPNTRVPDDKTRIRQNMQQTAQQPVLEGASVQDMSQHDVLKGRFVLETVLGAGGMGVVYKAKDLLKVEAQDRDPYVAIKVLSDEFKSHPEAFISLQRESRKSQKIAHPNIVNVHDFDRDGDTVFMTMEYMEGVPLDKLIKQYKSTGLPSDDAWSIIMDVSSALSHAHAQNISHSDFKPGNIFVSNKGVAKVFDFGISRAVAIAERTDDNPEDKTIFDAGTLGALTPAYASREMLQGKKPDVRDDVFALGCVAYETLTGSHPYNRVPADEAEKQGLKPKRIQTLKKYQWKAIEKALALRCEDRTESVDKFIHDLSPKIKTANRAVSAVILLISVGITIYFAFFQEKKFDPYEEFNIRNEIELKVRIDFYKDHLNSLLADPIFSDAWQDDVWKDISDLLKLTQGDEQWVFDSRGQIYSMYLTQIDDAIKAFKIKYAGSLIENAKRYTDDQDELDVRLEALSIASSKLKSNKAKQAVENEKAKIVAQEKKKEVKLFDLALANVNLQLKCQGRIKMGDFESAVLKLRELDIAHYNKVEQNIIKSFGMCIQEIGKAFPERASEAKKIGLRIFGRNSMLASIVIQPRDPCDVSLAGLGARGRRAVCHDTLLDKKSGPDLVVIPGKASIKPFAIGKYEVSIREINEYCNSGDKCTPIRGRSESLPASNIPFEQVRSYLKWLTRETGQKYRLPTRSEWRYAAKGKRQKLDANRNCKLSARGIQKGEELVKATMGAQNDWGVVNYVGNVQEWVYDKGRKLVAVGGSYDHPMDSCSFDTVKAQSGTPDLYTGFRVLREIRSAK